MPIQLYPTAGYIHSVAKGAGLGPLSDKDKDHLRRLAGIVAEIAAEPQQEEKRKLWYRHNSLEKVRPMLLVFPEDSWEEIIGEDQINLHLACKWFAGLQPEETAPDHSTISRFRSRL